MTLTKTTSWCYGDGAEIDLITFDLDLNLMHLYLYSIIGSLSTELFLMKSILGNFTKIPTQCLSLATL